MFSYADHLRGAVDNDRPTGKIAIDRAIEEAYEPHLNRLFDSFNAGARANQKRVYKDYLIDNRTTPNELKEAVNHLIENCKYMPTISELKLFLKKDVQSIQDREAQEHWKRLKEEERQHHQIREKFLELFDEQKLKDYTKWWFKKLYNIDAIGYGLTFESFEKCALFDWRDANGKFERIEEIAKRKAMKL